MKLSVVTRGEKIYAYNKFIFEQNYFLAYAYIFFIFVFTFFLEKCVSAAALNLAEYPANPFFCTQ